jgi:hypothetical protein
MTRSPRPSGKPANLSESVRRHLNMYALAAGATGIGVLALAPSAEAKIVYTPTHVLINGVGYDLDLNHDGIPDFTIVNSSSCDFTCHAGVEAFQRGAKNGIEAKHFADALHRGAPIGPNQRFTSHSTGVIMVSSTSGKTRGPWINVNDRFLGLKFIVNNKIHFGWARFNVKHQGEGYGAFTVTLTGYAYEAVPNKPIIAGQTKGPDEISIEGPDATLTTPTRKPVSLGLLAIGAPGLSIWRRKEPTAITQ